MDKDAYLPPKFKMGCRKISRFILSLSKNYSNEQNYDFLREIPELLKYVEFMEVYGVNKVRIFMQHSFMDSFYQFILFNHGCNFIGLFETSKNAEKVIDPLRTIEKIETYLSEDPPSITAKDFTHETTKQDNIHDNWFCVNCRHIGAPQLKLVKANPSIGLYKDGHIHLCPICGGSMIER